MRHSAIFCTEDACAFHRHFHMQSAGNHFDDLLNTSNRRSNNRHILGFKKNPSIFSNKRKFPIRRRRRILFIISLLILLAAFGIFYFRYRKDAAVITKPQSTNTLFQNPETLKNYHTKLTIALLTISQSCKEAEKLGLLTKTVWNNAIYKRSSPQTDLYTKKTNSDSFHDDFSVSLQSLRDGDAHTEAISKINKSKQAVAKLICNIHCAPLHQKDSLLDLQKYHAKHLQFIEAVLNPKGSLSSWTLTYHSLKDELDSHYINMKKHIHNLSSNASYL